MLEKLHKFLQEELFTLTIAQQPTINEKVEGQVVEREKRITEKTVQEAREKALKTGNKDDIIEAIETRAWLEYLDGKKRQAEKTYKKFWSILGRE